MWNKDISILSSPGTEEYLSDEEITSRFDKIIDETKEKKIDREAIYHRISNIIAELHCAHMGIYMKSNDPIYQEQCLTVGFYWFGDELRIAQCTEENKKYLGCVVTKFAGKSLNEVVKLFATIRSYETDTGEKASLEDRLYETDLTYLGLLNKDGVEITVEDKNGEETSFVGKMGAADAKMVSIGSLISSERQASILVRNMSNSVNYCYEGDDPVLVEKYGDIHDGITPDVEVATTYEDFLNGKDTVYERIISDLK